MSNPVAISQNLGNAAISVKLRPDIAHEISQLATKRQLPVDALVNEILQHYVADQSDITQSNGAKFLLSLAGIFDSGVGDTSENVQAIVSNFILQKHGQ